MSITPAVRRNLNRAASSAYESFGAACNALAGVALAGSCWFGELAAVHTARADLDDPEERAALEVDE